MKRKNPPTSTDKKSTKKQKKQAEEERDGCIVKIVHSPGTVNFDSDSDCA